MFERSKIALNKWLLCNHLLVASKKGMSALQMSRMLGVTYKTAWFMCHRLREAMKDDGSPLGGPGKVVRSTRLSLAARLPSKPRTVAPKKVVVALVEPAEKPAVPHCQRQREHFRAALVTNVHRDSHLRTDGSINYRRVGLEFASHGFVDHRFEFAAGETHSNTAENYFSILKRGMIGTYHQWSQAHIHRYLAEFDFRYSTKDISDRERADKALIGSFGKRLMFRRPAFARGLTITAFLRRLGSVVNAGTAISAPPAAQPILTKNSA